MRNFVLSILLALGSLVANGQAKLVEKVIRKNNEILIPYEKYVLANGLTVLVSEDHSDPLVQVDVTYHVGSGREQIGKSGFAHFFEHMMFEGSEHVPDGILDKLFPISNGSTNNDRTNYYESLPSSQLEAALWIEADRMGFLLDGVTQQKFEIQRATVKNERGQRVDNAPYGLVDETLGKTLYPYGHPYSWPTIGYMADLDQATVTDLKNFFLRWYSPNNATLTVVGDVSAATVVKLAERYFGNLPAGPSVAKITVNTPSLTEDRYAAYEDNVRFPLLQVVLPSVPFGHPDEALLDCLADILGGGETSLLYKNFVKPQKAVQASAYNNTAELAGEFTFRILSFPGASLVQVQRQLAATLAELEQRGVTQADVVAYQNSAEAALLSPLQSAAGKSRLLAQGQTLLGNPNYLPLYLNQLRAITPQQVMRVYNQYLKGQHAVVLSVVPKGQDSLKASSVANYQASQAGYTPPKDEYTGLVYHKAQDNWDRKLQPKLGANPPPTVPPYSVQKLPNGAELLIAKNNELPLFSFQLLLMGGRRLEQNLLDKAGIAQLTVSMLNESTREHTTEQLAQREKELGGEVSLTLGTSAITVQVSGLVKNLGQLAALAEERLRQPRFDTADFARVKKRQLEQLLNVPTQPPAMANAAFFRRIYGPGNALARPQLGTPQSLQSLTLQDVKAFYQQLIAPATMYGVLVGDVDDKLAATQLGPLGSLPPGPTALPPFPPAPVVDSTRIYLVDKPGAPQSELRIGYLALPFDATGPFYRADLMNYNLGEPFGSRLNQRLRETLGYTYGASSGFNGSLVPGPFTIRTAVRAGVTDSAIVEVVQQLKTYRQQGITPAELDFLKSSVSQRDALKYETLGAKAGFLSQVLLYHLPKGFVQQQAGILQGFTTAEASSLATQYLPLERMLIVVVGDKASLLPKLKALGYPLQEVTYLGEIIP